jgi:hypothetical protein
MIVDYGIKVKLNVDFSIIRETLERLGIKNDFTKKFYPSCYCITSENPEIFYISHFKHIFKFLNKPTNYDEIDDLRLKTITQLLSNWNLIELIDEIDTIMSEKITTLKKSDKHNYEIVHKYMFSKKIVYPL